MKCPGSGTEVAPGTKLFSCCPGCNLWVRAEHYDHPDGQRHFKLIDHNKTPNQPPKPWRQSPDTPKPGDPVDHESPWAVWTQELREGKPDFEHELGYHRACRNCGEHDPPVQSACPFKMGILVGMQLKEDDIKTKSTEFVTAAAEGMVEYWRLKAEAAEGRLKRLGETTRDQYWKAKVGHLGVDPAVVRKRIEFVLDEVNADRRTREQALDDLVDHVMHGYTLLEQAQRSVDAVQSEES